jgi:8-oxo-dGTP pyrophosphatase MutT (NUDIX family)
MTVELPDGKRYEYTRIEPAGIGVGVIGFNAAGEVLLEREYRHGVGEVVWQVPGGLTAPGEDLQTAGLRELQEETGYAPAGCERRHRDLSWHGVGQPRLWRGVQPHLPGARAGSGRRPLRTTTASS